MPNPQPAINVTPAPQPAAYAADTKPNYDVPAIEGPPKRVTTEFGIVEQPRSAFDRGGPCDWMK
jgi:hypothetical protein